VIGVGTESRDSTLGACARAALDEVARLILPYGKEAKLLSLPSGEDGSGQSPGSVTILSCLKSRICFV
jgi:hypothetical protein